jgi:hypothetical protein
MIRVSTQSFSRAKVTFRTLYNGSYTELSTPRNALSEANDISDANESVGQVRDPRKGEFGALWQAYGSLVNLNNLLNRSSPWK